MNLKNATDKWKKDKPLHLPRKSTKAGKKGQVYVVKEGKKRLIHFGDSTMEDLSQHKDQKRRKSYLSRSGGIKDKSGNLTKDNKNSANYYSRVYLWNAK